MIWVNFFHIYQPPDWEEGTIRKVARECYRPLFAILKRNPPVKITLNINASLTEQLVKYDLNDILEDIILLAKKGQIEFTHSAKYHLILPLFRADIISQQIRLNQETNEKYLGAVYKPTGFFSPEMAWGQNLIPVLEKLKIQWVILDEISYHKNIGQLDFNHGYQIKNTGIKVVFRNRTVSNFFAFEADPRRPEGFFQKIREDGRSDKILITGMDGENLGHHRKDTEKLWENIITRKEISTLTCSELLKSYGDFENINPVPASWSTEEDDFAENIPYILWQSYLNPIHQKQWALVDKILLLMKKAERQKDKKYREANKLLAKALASDQFWWASMRPWWSVDIIIKEAKELAGVLAPLVTITIAELNQVNQLLSELENLVNDWQTSGKAKARAEEYMRKVGFVPQLGGKKITE